MVVGKVQVFDGRPVLAVHRNSGGVGVGGWVFGVRG